IAAPFLWAVMAKRPNSLAYKELWLETRYSRGPLLLIEIGRVILGVIIISFWVFGYLSTEVATLVAVPIVIGVLVIFGKRLQQFYERLQSRFLTTLNALETAANEQHSATAAMNRRREELESTLTPWDAHIVELDVAPQADYIGKSLAELGWGEKYGINIVYIKRGEKLMMLPTRNAILLPFDRVGL